MLPMAIQAIWRVESVAVADGGDVDGEICRCNRIVEDGTNYAVERLADYHNRLGGEGRAEADRRILLAGVFKMDGGPAADDFLAAQQRRFGSVCQVVCFFYGAGRRGSAAGGVGGTEDGVR